MICKRGGFIIQRHNKLRDLEADLLGTVCSDVEVKPVFQDITEEQLSRGSNRAQDARLDIQAHGFWDTQSSAFFDVRVATLMLSHSHSRSIAFMKMTRGDCTKRRVFDVEHGSFTPLVML